MGYPIGSNCPIVLTQLFNRSTVRGFAVILESRHLEVHSTRDFVTDKIDVKVICSQENKNLQLAGPTQAKAASRRGFEIQN